MGWLFRDLRVEPLGRLRLAKLASNRNAKLPVRLSGQPRGSLPGSRDFEYEGRLFRQGDNAPELVVFVAKAEDVVAWAGMPQKKYEFMTGFQRPLDPGRKAEITDFFDVPENCSPTSLVVALRSDLVSIKEDPARGGTESDPSKPVTIRIRVPDYGNLTLEQLFQELRRMLANRLEAEVPTDNTTSLPAAPDLEEEEDVVEIEKSYLTDYVASLDREVHRANLPQAESETLWDGIFNLLKPAFLVDGQHRVKGAADCEKSVPFSVCGVVGASWPEQVFQFVVVNQKAKPIDAPFLSAIVNTSLNSSELDSIQSRLSKAGVRLFEYETIDTLQNSRDSPFYHMIQQSIAGAPSDRYFLPFVGMRQLAHQFRKASGEVYRRFGRSVATGTNEAERKDNWEQKVWFQYFFAFWQAIKDQFSNADQDLDLWRPKRQLLYAISMKTLQDLFLENLFVIHGYNPVHSVDEFTPIAVQFAKKIPADFFLQEWQVKQLTAGDGPDLLNQAMRVAMEGGRWRMTTLLRGRRS